MTFRRAGMRGASFSGGDDTARSTPSMRTRTRERVS